jgi:GTP-binding protein Era
LPNNPFYYDSDIVTTQQYRELYKELIREAIFENLSDEIPYESDVIIKKVDENQKIEHIYAQIIVNKESQKGMIIGKGGATIKRLGIASRNKIQELLGEQIFLKLSVSVKKGWNKNKELLKQVGYNI